MSKILITGGAGLIGSHVVRRFVNNYPDYQIVSLDKLDRALHCLNSKDVEAKSNYEFIKGDIVDADFINGLFETYKFDSVIHLAAEPSDQEALNHPVNTGLTNVVGTVNLLNASKKYWKENYVLHRFYHVSTDELNGGTSASDSLTSKACADPFVRAYHEIYGLDVVISNCSNNYRASDFSEKVIAMNNFENNKPVPVFGRGQEIQDWLWVEDQACAIDVIFHQSEAGETYNIGGHKEWYSTQPDKREKLES